MIGTMLKTAVDWIIRVIEWAVARRRAKAGALRKKADRAMSRVNANNAEVLWNDRLHRSVSRTNRLARQWNSASHTADFLDRLENEVKSEERFLDEIELQSGINYKLWRGLAEARQRLDELRNLVDAERYGGDCEEHRRREEEVQQILRERKASE